MYVSKRVMRKGRERSLIQAPPPPKTKKEAKEGEDVPELSNETKWGKKYSREGEKSERFCNLKIWIPSQQLAVQAGDRHCSQAQYHVLYPPRKWACIWSGGELGKNFLLVYLSYCDRIISKNGLRMKSNNTSTVILNFQWWSSLKIQKPQGRTRGGGGSPLTVHQFL